MRIALVTPYSPDIGGGSAQLRSHLRDLSDLDVHWYYLAAQPASVHHKNWTWLGKRFSFGELVSDLSARAGLPGSKARARDVLARIDADLYWVVGHYEGISLASELCDQRKPLHLTIHDDPFGTWRRSGRFRFFSPLLRRTYASLLRRARGIDVTSWGMRNLYRQKYGIKCFSLYLHVPAFPQPAAAPDPAQLTVGHIGTLYHPEPFRRFLAACQRIAAEQNRRLRFIRIGASPEMDQFAREHPATFESHGDLDESMAVPLLATCDLLYAMYPPGRKYQLFRRTSMPIKLSTYVQAQRPVFAHSPLDSGLARVVGSAGVGCVCSSLDESELVRRIRQTFATPFPPDRFESLRRELMGFDQVRKLRAALTGGDWQLLPESDFRD